jgi:hypothetical protein
MCRSGLYSSGSECDAVGFPRSGKFLDHISDCQFVEKDRALCSWCFRIGLSNFNFVFNYIFCCSWQCEHTLPIHHCRHKSPPLHSLLGQFSPLHIFIICSLEFMFHSPSTWLDMILSHLYSPVILKIYFLTIWLNVTLLLPYLSSE